jgi:hypothetical protein
VFRGLLSVLGCGPRYSRVIVVDDRVRVRMGWAFGADIPLSSIAQVRADDGRVCAIGVHGWRGRWLVNGAATGLVALDIDPPSRARVCGVPVRLRRLRVSVEDPRGLLEFLA